MVAAPENQFRTIGERAEDAERLPSDDEEQTPVTQDLTPASHDGARIDDNAADADHPVEQIESLCTECMENGTTRLMLTSLPFFREVVILSFQCDHCGNRNAEVQPASRVQERGCLYTVKVVDRNDIDRQLVRSEYCQITLPEFELTIPPSGKGSLTTVQGIVDATIRDLEMDQPLRMHQEAEVYDKIEALIKRLRPIIDEEIGPMPTFTVKLDDPSGNSFATPSLELGLSDPKWQKREYERTREDNIKLGLVDADAPVAAEATLTDDYQGERPEEVHSFPSECMSCGATLQTLMKTLAIPHFKEVILMSANCHSCGYRDTEIKTGGAIADLGKKITLQIEDEEDLKRDILKSDTAGLEIPEIELDLVPGTLGGRFTTVEGILSQIYEELDDRVFARGDSAVGDGKDAMETFLGRLKAIMAVEHPFTVIIDDPLANSYIQNPYAPDEDPKLSIEEYERSHDQNEELGLLDMVTSGYEGEAEAKAAYEASQQAERLAALRVDTPDR